MNDSVLIHFKVYMKDKFYKHKIRQSEDFTLTGKALTRFFLDLPTYLRLQAKEHKLGAI